MKSRNNILLLSPLPPPVGGIASWTQNLLQYIKDSEQKNIVHLNTAIKIRNITQQYLLIRIAGGILESVHIISQFIIYCLKYHPRVVHATTSASFGLFKDIVISFICKIFQIKLILHFRFGRTPELAEKQNWEWKMLIFVTRMSNTSIVIDSLSFDTFKTNKIFNVSLIPNPCSTEVEQLAHQPINDFLSNELIFVGHIIPTKGIFELIHSIIEIKQNIKLTMIGPVDSSIKKQLIEFAYKKNGGHWLKFEGVKSKLDVLELMQKSHMLLLPSYTEGFPNVILEAMACGCPVIATNVGAIPDMLGIHTENPAGICLPPRDIKKLKEAIELLLENSSKRQLMAQNGKTNVLNNYTMSLIFNKYRDLWSN